MLYLQGKNQKAKLQKKKIPHQTPSRNICKNLIVTASSIVVVVVAAAGAFVDTAAAVVFALIAAVAIVADDDDAIYCGYLYRKPFLLNFVFLLVSDVGSL